MFCREFVLHRTLRLGFFFIEVKPRQPAVLKTLVDMRCELAENWLRTCAADILRTHLALASLLLFSRFAPGAFILSRQPG